MLVSGIQVDLPKTKSAALSGQDEPLSISIKRSGQLYINNTTIQKKDLVKRLRAITKENYSSRLFVRGDKQVGYGEVIEIIALLNKSGFSKVSLVTETDS
jgi:biopolymer transport protein TolR